MQTDQVDMMEGDDGPARPDKSDGMHKPSHKVDGLGLCACWNLFKRGVRGAPGHPSSFPFVFLPHKCPTRLCAENYEYRPLETNSLIHS